VLAVQHALGQKGVQVRITLRESQGQNGWPARWGFDSCRDIKTINEEQK
jgi:hypothetical protein